MSRSRIVAVIGGGAWGTAFAVHLARSGTVVQQWIREADVVAEVCAERRNDSFLPGIAMPDGLSAHHDLEAALAGAGTLVFAVPSAHARSIYTQIAPLAPAVPCVILTKGIEEQSLELPTQVAAGLLGAERGLAVISGPSFAAELARERPTAVVVASDDAELAARIQREMASQALRLYTNRDVIGVQVAGALKNVYAIAAGVLAGLSSGLNAQAALITRGLAELSRLGCAMGGQASTFAGLSGLGDLVLTCTGDLSRNRTLGLRMGQGESLQAILEGSLTVAEGVRTCRSARGLARRHEIEMPIVEQVYRMLFAGVPPQEALERLMNRPLTAEDDAKA